jgi:hypothetical protein
VEEVTMLSRTKPEIDRLLDASQHAVRVRFALHDSVMELRQGQEPRSLITGILWAANLLRALNEAAVEAGVLDPASVSSEVPDVA